MGTLPDIVASYLDPVDEHHADEENRFDDERKVPTGYLAVLAVLLDAAPPDQLAPLEARLARSGVETPVAIRLN